MNMAEVTNLSQNSRKKVNEQLVRIKQELQNESILSDYDMSDAEEEMSQPLPQQFYQDLDDELDGQPREIYVSRLMSKCNKEFFKINSYRERLAERASDHQGCPTTRLVKRRSTPSSTKEHKCANDCYILQAFINGERTREIHDVFSNSTQNPITIEEESEKEQDKFVSPDLYSTVTKILAAVNEIARQQASDSFALQQIQSDVCSINTRFNRFQGSLNQILAVLPRDTPTTSAQVKQLQNDVSKLDSAICTINKRFIDNEKTNDTVNVIVTESEPQNGVAASDRSFAEVVCSQVNHKTGQKQQNESILDKTETNTEKEIHLHLKSKNYNEKDTLQKGNTNVEKCKSKTQSARATYKLKETSDKYGSKTVPNYAHDRLEQDTNENSNTDENTGKFFAARRRSYRHSTASFFIGNIDPSVSESDVVDYIQQGCVRVRRITMFYGKNGSSARINIDREDSDLVENIGFWPENVSCRKWVRQSDWQQERKQRQQRRQRQNRPHEYKNDNLNRHDRRENSESRHSDSANRHNNYRPRSLRYDEDQDTYIDRQYNNHSDSQYSDNRSSDYNTYSRTDETDCKRISVWNPDYD